MATASPIVTRAIKLAEEAGWPVRFSNGKIVITCGDGFNLTIGQPAMQNRETLRKFESKAQQYGLIDGPAKTPAEREAEEKAMAEEKAVKEAEKQAATAKKQAEAKAAQEKAKAVVEQAAKLPPAPASPAFVEPLTKTVPVVKVSVPAQPTPATVAKKAAAKAEGPKRDADGFPPFSPDMLVAKDYSGYKLPNGRYFCPNCWERGDKETFKMPQGLAAHRGFKHGSFTKGADAVTEETKLPESVATALALLRDELTEALADTADAAQVREMEGRLADLNKILAERDKRLGEMEGKVRELGKALEIKETLVKTLTKERDAAQRDAEGRKTLLDNERGRYEAEVKTAMDVIEQDLKQIRQWTNELAPVKAVAKIDDLLNKYIGG